MNHVFGPVPSRRLGRSLGVNNIPPKYCTIACVYCQLSDSQRVSIQTQSFFDPQVVTADVAAALEIHGADTDYVIVVPDSEPTIDADLAAYRIFAGTGINTELNVAAERGEFSVSDDLSDGILAITAVHPIREADLHHLIEREGGTWSVVTQLLASGALLQKTYRGERFYLARLRPERSRTPQRASTPDDSKPNPASTAINNTPPR